MKIGIISDTHVHSDTSKLNAFINSHLVDMDMIIHAGDIVSMASLRVLKDQTNFLGVYGNCDDEDVKAKLKEKEIINIEGHTIGIYHGHGKKKSFDNVAEYFKCEEVDIIIFGHSHQPMINTVGRILFLNPGSIFCKRKEPWFSYIILEITKYRLSATIIFKDNHNS